MKHLRLALRVSSSSGVDPFATLVAWRATDVGVLTCPHTTPAAVEASTQYVVARREWPFVHTTASNHDHSLDRAEGPRPRLHRGGRRQGPGRWCDVHPDGREMVVPRRPT